MWVFHFKMKKNQQQSKEIRFINVPNKMFQLLACGLKTYRKLFPAFFQGLTEFKHLKGSLFKFKAIN